VCHRKGRSSVSRVVLVMSTYPGPAAIAGIQQVAGEIGVTDKYLITQGHEPLGTALITFGGRHLVTTRPVRACRGA
jgi:hypothetical protein